MQNQTGHRGAFSPAWLRWQIVTVLPFATHELIHSNHRADNVRLYPRRNTRNKMGSCRRGSPLATVRRAMPFARVSNERTVQPAR